MSHAPEVTVIEPGRLARNYWRDLWRKRELLLFLAWRDISVRYKQTVIGIAWALIRPALTMVVFVLFRRMVGAPAQPGVPDALLVLAAVLPWQFFSSAVVDSSGSLVGNANLVSKVYFPRLLVPLASIGVSVVDFAVTLAMLALALGYYRFVPPPQFALLPLFVLLAALLASGAGILLAALNVRYRDFRYVIPFVVQFGLFVSPIAFVSENVPEAWRPLYFLNPMVGVIDGFRWCILGGAVRVEWASLATSCAMAAALVSIAVTYFRRTERTFADHI